MPKRETPFGWTLADDVFEPKDLQDNGPRKAVALLFDQVRAPVLVAKGQGEFAEEIIEVAKPPASILLRTQCLLKLCRICNCRKKYPRMSMWL